MRYFLVLLFVIFILNGHSQSKIKGFEKELLEFRYSLYPILDTMDYNEISSFDLDYQHPLTVSVNAFYESNKDAFEEFRLNILKRYLDVELNLSHFKEDSGFYNSALYKLMHNKDSDELKEIISFRNSPLFQLMVINPTSHCMLYLNIYHAQSEGPQSLAKRTMVNQIASRKIKTVKKSKFIWTIYFDYYYNVYEFEYDVEKVDLKLEKKYIRAN
jgi:hypothetical protein